MSRITFAFCAAIGPAAEVSQPAREVGLRAMAIMPEVNLFDSVSPVPAPGATAAQAGVIETVMAATLASAPAAVAPVAIAPAVAEPATVTLLASEPVVVETVIETMIELP